MSPVLPSVGAGRYCVHAGACNAECPAFEVCEVKAKLAGERFSSRFSHRPGMPPQETSRFDISVTSTLNENLPYTILQGASLSRRSRLSLEPRGRALSLADESGPSPCALGAPPPSTRPCFARVSFTTPARRRTDWC